MELQTVHGTRAVYQQGCRCLACRAANAAYVGTALVPANAAVAKLGELEAKGIGLRQAAKLSGTGVSTLQAIRSGEREWVRASTEAGILAVEPKPAMGQRINGHRTRHLLRSLLLEGFTRAEIARRLRLRTPRLQFDHRHVTVRNALKVRALWRTVMSDEIRV